MRDYKRSLQHYEEALKVIPMGTSTFSKNPNLFTIGACPLFIKSAKGCRLTDLDGNEYIDYGMALAPVILGYAHSEVDSAAKAGIDEGLIFTLACPEEAELASKVIELVPCAEMVRFAKNGSDVCEGAIRLARNYTGKLKVMTVNGYHGFHDWFIASTPRNKGVPSVMAEWIINHPFNDIDSIEATIKKSADEIAVLIMEPVINYEPKPNFLKKIRELTEQNNIILIFDEMKTGFRLDVGGAQKYFNVIPDLAVYAKALANGYPLSMLAGSKKLMQQLEDENCFLSASYATEKASIKAALTTLEIIQRDQVLAHIWRIGERLKQGIAALINKHGVSSVLKIVGYPPMSHFIITESNGQTVNEIKSYMQQECAERGLLFIGYHHPSFAHQEKEIDQTLAIYDEVMKLLRQSLEKGDLKEKLKGRPISAFGVRR
ncbi:MAG: class III aminotransferase [Candidatus Saganbacteria bacterium]|uniref:Class III aminotransferase n=1 Tax=Candidatus Saganbacteria bacterium TaxID=2575572 RepID=A0A833L2J4_UNCSA|nr:MAG: class III aminotransferase [Candidatus Saganbacteria bacterium]